MKYTLSKYCAAVLTCLLLVGGSAAQTIPIYENFGIVTETPQIDATVFANYGTFSVFSSPLPYDFTNTRYFTNRGTMSSIPGFRFETALNLGPSQPAVNFVNEIGGVVEAQDTLGIISAFSGQVLSPSYLLVTADNIVNHGFLLAGAAGLVQLVGNNVDVSRGGLGISRIEESSTFNESITQGTFFPDPGIYDAYWGGYTNGVMQVGPLLTISKTATNVASPLFTVTNSSQSAFGFRTSLTPLKNPVSSVFTNVGGMDPTSGKPTNIMRQAAFVAFSDTNFVGTIKWAPASSPQFPMQTAVVEIKLPETNVITGDLEFSTLYVTDTLASTTNYFMITNLVSAPETYLPATLAVTRQAPLEWIIAAGGKGTLTNTYFFDSKDTNFLPVVTNFYAAYSASISDLSSEPPSVPLLDPTDFPGRIEINAQNLNMNRTRIRGTGLVSLRTSNLIGATNLVVDAENVLFNLGVTSGNLNIQGVLPDEVVRLNGTLSVWSALWTNYLGIAVTNQVPDPSGSGTTNQAGSQLVEIAYHMLIVDATGLRSTKPVIMHDLFLQGDQVTLNDNVTLTRNYLITSPSFTLNSRLVLSTNDWYSTNAPNLRSFTIGKAGNLFVSNVGNFGEDMPSGYDTFNNSGSLAASGLLIRASDFKSSGVLTSRVDGLLIEAQSAQFQGASTMSANDLQVSAADIRFDNSTNIAAGVLILNATSSLADSGGGANNSFLAINGIQLPTKPASGDLLGTTITISGPRFDLVESVWAGDDRGASANGFQDNVAIGHLVLDGGTGTTLSFRGPNGRNGMYVDFLEFTGSISNSIVAGDLGAGLQVDPSLTIYFADSNLPADQLEQQSGGRLVHVDFAGPGNFVQVPTRSGGTVQMSGVVRNSTTIDSDNDGIPNAYDPYPLDADTPLQLSGFRANGQTSIALSWQAQPGVNYQVEFTTSVANPTWQPLSSFTNNESAPKTAVVQDQLSGDHAQRYYRVRSGQ